MVFIDTVDFRPVTNQVEGAVAYADPLTAFVRHKKSDSGRAHTFDFGMIFFVLTDRIVAFEKIFFERNADIVTLYHEFAQIFRYESAGYFTALIAAHTIGEYRQDTYRGKCLDGHHILLIFSLALVLVHSDCNFHPYSSHLNASPQSGTNIISVEPTFILS